MCFSFIDGQICKILYLNIFLVVQIHKKKTKFAKLNALVSEYGKNKFCVHFFCLICSSYYFSLKFSLYTNKPKAFSAVYPCDFENWRAILAYYYELFSKIYFLKSSMKVIKLNFSVFDWVRKCGITYIYIVNPPVGLYLLL